MYFHKAADALSATGGGLSTADGVAQRDVPTPAMAPVPMPDAAPVRPVPVPVPALPPVPDRPIAQPFPDAGVGRPAPVMYTAQPTTVQKKKDDYKIKPVDPKYIQLPPRDKVLGIVYDDKGLERAIVAQIVADLKSQVPPVTTFPPETLKFPPLPVISPPGVPYQPKTVAYTPRQVYVEPGYVVHRRLHFEEKNSERAGWDLGPLSTLVSAGYFYRDALLWPQSLASGLVHGFWDTSAGKCLPGSPSPYYLYPPGLTITGTAVEGAIVTGTVFLLP